MQTAQTEQGSAQPGSNAPRRKVGINYCDTYCNFYTLEQMQIIRREPYLSQMIPNLSRVIKGHENIQKLETEKRIHECQVLDPHPDQIL